MKTPKSSNGMTLSPLALALPTLGQLIAEPAFILIDTAIVGHVGESALADSSLFRRNARLEFFRHHLQTTCYYCLKCALVTYTIWAGKLLLCH